MELDEPEETALPPEDEQPEEADILDIELSQVSERDAMLAAVMRDQTEKAEHEEEVRQTHARIQGYGRRHVVLALATVLTVWIWIWSPSALSIPTPGPPPTEQEKATLRLVMYFQGMEYIRLTDRDYRILGRSDRHVLSYSSVEPIDEFVRDRANIFDPAVIG
jgi:hypothetical protein